jgi:serine/threonine protein kinase
MPITAHSANSRMRVPDPVRITGSFGTISTQIEPPPAVCSAVTTSRLPTPAMTLILGPFELIAPTGQGAMAEVWQATHRGQAVPAAVKIVTAPIGQHHKFRAWFAHELRAVARLDHPGVVRLYDHGEIGAEVAAASGDRLPRGAPYLVMEWIDGGPLSAKAGRLGWPALRQVLLGLLDALGHAHARGVIHRDLKPDNVLLAERGPVLTDFGVAYTAERVADERSEAFAGTPNYMAPEQVTGDLRALGPWTDLYALGCLAFTLVRGRPPFDGGAATEVARAQLLAPVPRLDPGLPVPDGFEAWLARMLHKRTGDRFRFAADAAVALLALPDDAPALPGIGR